MTDAEFARLNKPLLDIDCLWNRFAKEVGGRIIYNYHSRPERRIVLRDPDWLNRSVALTCVRAARDAGGQPLGLRYFLDIGANYDTDHDRTYWTEAVARLSIGEVNPETLEPLLARAWELLKHVDLEDLRRHGKVSKFPPGSAVYSKEQIVELPSHEPHDRLQN